VLTVYHDHNGDWEFHGATSDKVTLLCVHHLVDRDKTLNELVGLPVGWCAWRESMGAPWQRETFKPGEDEETAEE
jgi:hypothetical protein